MPWRLLLILLFTCGNMQAMAEPETSELFIRAQEKYAVREFESALSLIKQAVAISPDESIYQHLLGKCYGKIAEQANWIKAVSYAKKTREAFETAVELDRQNIDALRDLMEYYRQAPKFLGGSTAKADEIETYLNSLPIPDNPG